ncbi:MAG: T9SS type A sorting domain-containing protein [Saprospiraceae bacterium]
MNIKHLLTISFSILLISNLTYSQDTLITEWEIIDSSPLVNGNAEAWAIGSDQNGNLFWGVNKDRPGFFEYMDAMVFKLDEEGNTIWLDTAAIGVFAQQSYHLKVTDNVVYLGGRTCKTIGIDSCDVLVFTTDVNTGETGWEFTWDGGYGYEEVDGISVETDEIILTGWTKGNGTEMDVLLMKIGFDGSVIWQTNWGSMTAKDDHQDGHIVVDDSFIYISGLYDGSPLLGWNGRALLAKFDKTNGNFVDSVKYGRQDQWVNAENALGMTTDGTYLYTTGYTTTSPNNWDIFVAKFDKDLNQIWYTTWGGENDTESARAITIDDDGSIYIGGNTASYGNGGFEMALLKLDPSGNIEWYKTWGGTLDDQILDIHLHDHNLYLTGKTQSFHPSQKWEAVLLNVNLENFNTSNKNVFNQKPEWQIFPNPTSNSAILKLNNFLFQTQEIAVYNLMGQKVMHLNNIASQEININKENIGTGIFLVQVVDVNQNTSVRKLIIH